MSEILAHGLRENTNELLKLISCFDYETFNRVPLQGGWSPGVITEHLLLQYLHVIKILNSKAKPIDRDEQDMIAPISNVLTTVHTK